MPPFILQLLDYRKYIYKINKYNFTISGVFYYVFIKKSIKYILMFCLDDAALDIIKKIYVFITINLIIP